MKTVVVHINKEPFDIRIDRSTPYGNPYSHKDGTAALYRVKTRKEAIEAYRRLLEADEGLQQLIRPLKGKRLGCWCKPEKSCHGDVIAEFLDRDDRLFTLFSE